MVDIAKVTVVGTLGFLSQMANIEIIFKVIIAALTLIYVGGKTIKMFRDWNRKDKDE